MAIKVSVPAPLRQYCNKQKEIELNGANVKEVLDSMSKDYNLLYTKICDESGNVRHYVNLYINGVDIKKKESLQSSLQQGDSITIIPAVAGGK